MSNDDAGPACHDALQRILDDEQRGAVFYRLAGIEEFRLAQDFASRQFASVLETDQGRVADGRNDVFFNLGHGWEPNGPEPGLQAGASAPRREAPCFSYGARRTPGGATT